MKNHIHIHTSRALRLAALAALLTGPAVFGQTTWNGTTTGNWNVAGNWIGGVLPASGADIVFYSSSANLSNTSTFMGTSNRNVGNLTFNANVG